MSAKQHFTTEQARDIGDKLGIDWSRFDVEQFRMGLDVELEHGRRDPSTDVTGNDPKRWSRKPTRNTARTNPSVATFPEESPAGFR